MNLTVTQKEEIKSVLSRIQSIEKKIQNIKPNLDWALEIENTKEASKLQKAMDYGYNQIRNMISMQAQSMKLEFNEMVGLINSFE